MTPKRKKSLYGIVAFFCATDLLAALLFLQARERAALALYDGLTRETRAIAAAKEWNRLDALMERHYAPEAVISIYIENPPEMPTANLVLSSLTVPRDRYAALVRKQMAMTAGDYAFETRLLDVRPAGFSGRMTVTYSLQDAVTIAQEKKTALTTEGTCRLTVGFPGFSLHPLIESQVCELTAKAAPAP